MEIVIFNKKSNLFCLEVIVFARLLALGNLVILAFTKVHHTN